MSRNSQDIPRRTFIRRAATICGVVSLGWPARLSWAVSGSSAGSLRLAYYTDIHARTEWGTPDAMQLAAEAITTHKADLVICGGDMITDGYQSSSGMVRERWDVYLDMHRAISPEPVYVLGNHDLVGVEPGDGSVPAADPRADARARLNMDQTYRSFNHAGYHVILLDSVEVTRDEFKYRGYVDDSQMEWLRADLSSVGPDTPIILVSHMPLLTSFFQATAGVQAAVPPNRGLVNNREVLALFEKHRLLLVLQGHLHVNEMLRWRDTTFITGGAVCGKWWRGAWHGTPEGFGILDLHPDQVNWHYHTFGWNARRPPGV